MSATAIMETAWRSQPLLRPGVRAGVYPQRDLNDESAVERYLSRALMGLTPPPAARARLWPFFLQKVAGLEAGLCGLKEPALDRMIARLRERLTREPLAAELLVSVLAVLREVARRELAMRPHDVQLIGARVLIEGMVAEMATGEGKTLTAALAAGAAALAGIPVHVVTVNEYLVTRDVATLAPFYRRLGVTVAAVTADASETARREAYRADIVYGTNKQFAFDYLRDRLLLGHDNDDLALRLDGLIHPAPRLPQLLLRGLYFAIVDEADSVFVDEARTPLILARLQQADEKQTELYRRAVWLSGQLRVGDDYRLDETERRATLTACGESRLDEIARPFGGLWAGTRQRAALITQALAARHFFVRDRHYLIREGRIEIIDENTGRTMADRQWEAGLHQMIEAREDLVVSAPQETVARLSYQRFFQRYRRLAGMSGTLHEVRGELRRVYGLQTVRIPTHRPVKRMDLGARYFWRVEDKWRAVAARAQTLAQSGRPVLVGTCALEDSEKLSALLTAVGVAHRLLNARQDEEEAAIVAQAGSAGQITIATNMAGRGTDIVLGPGVAEKGGLHVIVCERNAARRIDRQLRGRAARQGDPGSFEFFESLEDERVLTYFKRSVILFSRLFARHGETCPAFIGGSLGRLAQRLTEWRHRGMRRALQQLDEARTTMMAFSGRAE